MKPEGAIALKTPADLAIASLEEAFMLVDQEARTGTPTPNLMRVNVPLVKNKEEHEYLESIQGVFTKLAEDNPLAPIRDFVYVENEELTEGEWYVQFVVDPKDDQSEQLIVGTVWSEGVPPATPGEEDLDPDTSGETQQDAPTPNEIRRTPSTIGEAIDMMCSSIKSWFQSHPNTQNVASIEILCGSKAVFDIALEARDLINRGVYVDCKTDKDVAENSWKARFSTVDGRELGVTEGSF